MNISDLDIIKECRRYYDEAVNIRRDIHMHPETGFDVQRTADIAAAELKKLGISTRTGVGQTGVTGDIIIKNAKKCIALRADMDALSMQELGNAPYKSKTDGKAHMCGHDVHTAMLIGAAKVITAFKDKLKSNVRFVFQPSEEKWPGGAPKMIEDGVLNDVDEIYGLHVWPLLETGQYALRSGAFLAQADIFDLEIKGKGGHAAWPHLSVDPILIGSQFVTLLQSVVSRFTDPTEPTVVSVTKFHAGTAGNVIPETVRLGGTVRTFDKKNQKAVKEKIKSILSSVTAAHGISFSLNYQDGYPVTYNHPSCTSRVLDIAGSLVDKENIIYPCPLAMIGEDFGYYSKIIPSCFIMLGAGNKEINRMCHDPCFDVDENCMNYGMAMLVALALTFE